MLCGGLALTVDVARRLRVRTSYRLGVAASRFRLSIASGLCGPLGREAVPIVSAFVLLKHLAVMPSSGDVINPAVLVTYHRTFLRCVVSRGRKKWWKQ